MQAVQQQWEASVSVGYAARVGALFGGCLIFACVKGSDETRWWIDRRETTVSTAAAGGRHITHGYFYIFTLLICAVNQ